MDDLGPFCCLNLDCPDHGKRGHGNLTVTSRYGPGKTRRFLRCSTCKARFSERKGTPLFGARLAPTTATAVLAHVAEGVGTRKTARLTGVSKDTVARYTRLAGTHRTFSPSFPGLPTVFSTSRIRSSSVTFSRSRPGNRFRYSA